MAKAAPDTPTLVRRRLLLMGAACLGAGMLAPLAGCTPKSPLRVAQHRWAGYQFLSLAEEQGWLSRHVELLKTSSLPDTRQLLLQGTVMAATMTLDEVLKLREEGLTLQVPLIFNVSAGANALMTRPHITTLQGLRGHRVGVESSSLGALLLAKTLEIAGLRKSDITVVPIRGDHMAAWREGTLDALFTFEPNATALKRQGLHRLFDSRHLPQLIYGVLAVTRRGMETQGDAVRALIDAHFKGLHLWLDNRIDTAFLLAAHLQVSPETVSAIYAGLDLPDELFNREYLTPPATMLKQASETISRILVSEGYMKHVPDVEHLFTPDFLPQDTP